MTHGSLDTYRSDLGALASSGASVGSKYNALARCFFDILDEGVSAAPFNFSGPFAKLDYLLTEKGASAGLRRAVNGARTRFRHRSTMPPKLLEEHFGSDFRAVCDFLDMLCTDGRGDAPSHDADGPADAADPLPERCDCLRVIVVKVSGTVITAVTDSEVPHTVTVDASVPDRLYLLDIVRPRDQLNLVDCTVRPDGRARASIIIYEPDFLVNVTQIAGCFENFGADARLAIVRKFKAPANTEAINLGNFASQLLDEEVNAAVPDALDFASSARTFFRANAVNLATCGLTPSFRFDAIAQSANIHRAIHRDMATAVSGFDRSKVMLEPAFFSEMLGLQGRMDLMQLDYRVLVEQKSGKGAWPPDPDPDVPRYREAHYVQLLLYMAIMRLNYRERYEANGRQLSAFLMYSRYGRPLVALGPAPELLWDALKLRNLIVYYENRLAEGDTDVLCSLTPDSLNHGKPDRFWERYGRPQLAAVLDAYRTDDALALAYFRRMLHFVAREHALAKTGNRTKRGSGFAATWHSSVAEKLEDGNIYTGLTLISPDAAHDGPVERLVLSFRQDEANDIANFRPGDSVILYPYDADTEPDARRTMVFRCSIAAMEAAEIELSLRFAQSSAMPFLYRTGVQWAIEHDFMDSSHGALYQGLQAFLTSPRSRRDLLLFRRAPELDRTATLSLDHGAFNDLALRVKQARDLFLIIGPPGTGKTSFGLMTTLREALSDPTKSVLLLSYTNRAVDEICSKLVEEGLDFIRIGPAQSCLECYRPYLLKERLAACRKVTDLRAALGANRIYAATVASLNGAINLLQLKTFDLAIIDEASQILEPQLLSVLSAVDSGGAPAIRKVVMIGDHKQLPAVVQQTADESAVSVAELNGIGLTDCRHSLFERLLRRYGDDPSVTYMLHRQGRMHVDIADYPNRAFYGGTLSDAGCAHQHLPLVPSEPATLAERVASCHRISFVDICETPSPETPDKVNHSEAAFIADVVDAVRRREGASFGPSTVGIIVPYRNQIATVRTALTQRGIPADDITIDTVERYQGSQRKYIIYGFTVKRPSQLRFLTEHTFTDADGSVIDRKLNVAMTRAREFLILAGNARLLSASTVFSSLIEYVKQRGAFFICGV